ncbi:U-box domain-containing protein 4-like isoform X1 [Zingiber officinale]|uniref:U-box domain-containing protein 4-like isoform X1 n=1 Tax=Zingiber officinale TaxID=94328 RepID=UPI001C4AB448|nr:U-box domain-containing protein 4-like isoform X1 [Zingiber officinale]
MESVVVRGGPPEFRRRMERRCSSSSSDSGSVFSDCRSERSDDLALPESPSCGVEPSSLHRFLFSSSGCSDDDIQSLVSDLKSISVESQRRAAMGLRLLAKPSTETRVRIAEAGAVAPLVSLVSHPDPQLQEHAVTAILNLSLCEENKAAIAAAGAVPNLVRALGTGTLTACGNAACALLRLADLTDLPAAIGCCGAIPPLVDLLQKGGARGKKDAATALFALLAVEENAALAAEAGVVRPLLELMADPESGVEDKAAYVLLRVLAAPKGRAAAVDEGGVAVLVDMLEMGSKRQKEVAVLSLLEICEENEAYRMIVVREGAIPPLVALSHSSFRRVKEKVTRLVALLRGSTGRLPFNVERNSQYYSRTAVKSRVQ